MRENSTKLQKYTLPLRAAAIILALIVCFALFPGMVFYQPGNISGTGSAKVSGMVSDTRRIIFVGGAVANEGYYTITPQNTYGDIFAGAGLLPVSYTLGYDADRYVDFAADSIIVGFNEQGLMEPVNIFGLTQAAPLLAAGVDLSVAQAIIGANVLQKEQLIGVLGEETYLSVYYKLYCKAP